MYKKSLLMPKAKQLRDPCSKTAWALNSVNAVLETAARVKAPVIIQFSNGGAAFYAGKGIKPTSGARRTF